MIQNLLSDFSIVLAHTRAVVFKLWTQVSKGVQENMWGQYVYVQGK